MNLFQSYLVEEFAEEYQEGRISRREALKLIGSVMGRAVLASSFLAACASPVSEASHTSIPMPATAMPAATDATAPATQPTASMPAETPTAAGLLAAGLASLIGMQAWIIMAGNANLAPLTGVTLPFVSYGGSSLLMSFICLGLLLQVSADRD